MSDAANCICIHGYVSTCPLHGGKTLPNASPPSWKKTPFTECESTITLSEHAAQLQAACVELRRLIITAFVDNTSFILALDAANAIPIPTAALETAIAEARSQAIELCIKNIALHDMCECTCGWEADLGPKSPDIEIQFAAHLIKHLAALDAAKAKESK